MVVIPAGGNHPTHTKDTGTVLESVTAHRREQEMLCSRKEKSPKSLEKKKC